MAMFETVFAKRLGEQRKQKKVAVLLCFVMLHVPVGFRGSESGAATIGGTKWGMPCRKQQMVDDPDAWSLSAALLPFFF